MQQDTLKKIKKSTITTSSKKTPATETERRDHIARLTYKFIERYRKDLEALADK